ncbi:hypothetical protein KEM52_005794 [Ascosphaera acerosa]|nr:hypothetical protein KEM52_005794 [Ascosphaera acerosa]
MPETAREQNVHLPAGLTISQAITLLAALLAKNKPRADLSGPYRRHYEVCTAVLKENPFNALAPLLSWRPRDGAYAVLWTLGRKQKPVLYIAGERGVPDEKSKFIRRVWRILRKLKKRKRPSRAERNQWRSIEDEIPEEVHQLWQIVVRANYRVIQRRIWRHLNYVQQFHPYITPANFTNYYTHQFLNALVDACQLTADYIRRVDEVYGPLAAPRYFIRNKELMVTWQLLTAQLHNQMPHVWAEIDKVAITEHVGCSDQPQGYRRYSRHLYQICRVFLQLHQLIDSVRGRDGWVWDKVATIHLVNPRDLAHDRSPPPPPMCEDTLTRLVKAALKGNDQEAPADLCGQIDVRIAPPGPVVPPELQLAASLRQGISTGMAGRLSTSRPMSPASEAVLIYCDKEAELLFGRTLGKYRESWQFEEAMRLPPSDLQKIYRSLCAQLRAAAEEKARCEQPGRTMDDLREEESIKAAALSRKQCLEGMMLDSPERGPEEPLHLASSNTSAVSLVSA